MAAPVLRALPAIDVSSRADRVRAGWGELDALVVSELTNVRWLTGFTGSAGTAVVVDDEVVLVTDGRYGAQAERQLAAAGCRGRVLVGLSQTEQLELLTGTSLYGRSGVAAKSQTDEVSEEKHERKN